MTKLSGRQRIHESRQNRTENMDFALLQTGVYGAGFGFGKVRDGKGREGKGPRFEWARHCRLLLDGREASVGALTMGLCL